jgi:hypothetical protein
VMTMLLVFLIRVVKPQPAMPPRSKVHYRKLIRSMVHLFHTVPELRTAALCQALSFGSFNVFWLGATLCLQSPEFGWTPQAVGLVALVAAAAASASPMFGRLVISRSIRTARNAADGARGNGDRLGLAGGLQGTSGWDGGGAHRPGHRRDRRRYLEQDHPLRSRRRNSLASERDLLSHHVFRGRRHVDAYRHLLVDGRVARLVRARRGTGCDRPHTMLAGVVCVQ